MSRRTVMLMILDGLGWRTEPSDNAVALAHKPNFDRFWETAPHAFLRTSGADVGLPDGQMGNSEVGHLNIGAGRVVIQELPRIDTAIQNGSLSRKPELSAFIAALKKTGGRCQLFGLVSQGGVHAHQRHIAAVAQLIAEAGIPVFIHAITDGRDAPPKSGAHSIDQLLQDLPKGAEIVSVCGRYFAMDRDNRWKRIRRAYDLWVSASGARAASPSAAIRSAYTAGNTDEFVEPVAIGNYSGMDDGDGLLCANFRADRVREILAALLEPGFSSFERAKTIHFVGALGMVPYSRPLDKLMASLFPPEPMQDLLGEIVSNAGLHQLRAAETEKYAHVTYFLNGGREQRFPGEDRILIPSPKVATYDLKPEMSAPELTDKVVAAINSQKYDLIVLNFANPDMVGHTGNLRAAIQAVEAVDTGLGKIAKAVIGQGGALLVTADHGNCELMMNPETGGPHTAHTTNKVPVLLIGAGGDLRLHDGRLADVAPTLLSLMGLAQPSAMTGKTLLDGVSTAP